MKVRSAETGLTTYPDITVVCGPYLSDPDDKNTILNPSLVVDVTSDSTEQYDRGEKLQSYQRIPSLSAIVLISHREPLIEVFERQREGNWKRSEARRGARLHVDSINAALVVDEIFAVTGALA